MVTKSYIKISDSVTNEQSHLIQSENELELASPGNRLAAVLINQLLINLTYIPFYIYMSFSLLDNDKYYTDNETTFNGDYSQVISNWMSQPTTKYMIALTIVTLIIYALWQMYWMSKYGQSIGKRLLKIRVVRINGENPGFIHNVILREFIYQILVLFIGTVTLFFGYFVFLLAPAMVFIRRWNRRTLQDFLAGTIVVTDTNLAKEEKIKVRIPKQDN